MTITNNLPRFYPVMPDINWVEKVLAHGAKLVQLRLKNAPPDEINRQIARSLELGQKYNAIIIINDYWQEAIKLGAEFIHLGQEDLAAADLKAIKAARLKLGISTHSQEELEIALKAAPDYIALGPIYETKLKKMKWAPQGLARVKNWKKQISCPLVAIGGINLERAPLVLEAGADSVAIVTDIITAKSPEETIKKWVLLKK